MSHLRNERREVCRSLESQAQSPLNVPMGMRCAKPILPCHTRWNPRTRRKQRQTVVAHASGITALPAIVIAACTTIIFLAAAVICIIIMLRPLLKRLESLAIAAEAAAREMEKASVEFTLASIVINNDLPTTLDSMERASLEFEELGQSLNGLTGGLRKKPAAGKGAKDGKAAPSPEEGKSTGVTVYEMNPVEAIQATTINSMRKVAQDVSSLTAALTPAMVAWRKRLGFITERFEAASKDGKLKQLPDSSPEGSKSDASKRLPQPSNGSAAVASLPQLTTVTPGGGKSAEANLPETKPESSLERQSETAQLEETRVVGEVAKELAKAAEEVAEVARVSHSSIDDNLETAPQAHRGADLLERAAGYAQAFAQEAQKPANMQPLSDPQREVVPVSENFSILQDGMPASSSSSEIQRQQALDKELEDRRIAAQAVYSALANAEEAASAAAAASGALEKALQKVERDAEGSWWGWNGTASPPENGSEMQEFDGMAYLSSPFMAAKRTGDSDDVAKPPSATPSKSPKSARASKG